MVKRRKRTVSKRYISEREKKMLQFKKCMAKCQTERPWVAPCEMGCHQELRRAVKL